MKLADSPRIPVLPTDEDRQFALDASRMLAPYRLSKESLRVRIQETGGEQGVASLPPIAVRFLVDLLSEMAKGNAVTMIPVHAELTTQEAANILNVSRPFVVRLIKSAELPARKVGTHRRILFADLMAYKERIDADRNAALDELTNQAQELGMGY